MIFQPLEIDSPDFVLETGVRALLFWLSPQPHETRCSHLTDIHDEGRAISAAARRALGTSEGARDAKRHARRRSTRLRVAYVKRHSLPRRGLHQNQKLRLKDGVSALT